MKTPKTSTVVPVLIAAAIILAAAMSFAGQKAGTENQATSTDVKRETSEAIQTIKNYSVNQRDKAVKDVKVVLEDLDDRIDRLQSRIQQRWDEMDQSSRERVAKTLKALRKQRNELSEWYGGLKHSSASAWGHIKEGFVKGYETLSNAFDRAESEFSTGKSDKSGG